MTDRFAIRYTDAARDDLLRLFDFLLEQACTVNFDAAQHTVEAITTSIDQHLSQSPFIYRKAGQRPFLRELIIPIRGPGYMALYEIEGKAKVTILAVRHQLEDDYH